MAERRPLVLVNGQIQVLPTGDTLPGGGGGGSAPDYADPSTARVYSDDFAFGNTETGEVGELNWSFTNGSVTVVAPAANGNPGVIQRTSGTTASQVASFFAAAAAAGPNVFWSDLQEMTWIVNITTLNTDYRLVFGGSADWSSITGINTVSIDRNPTDTSWHATCRDQTGSSSRLAIAAFALGWNKLRIRRLSSLSYGFSVNGGTEITLDASNPPPTNALFQPGFQIQPTTTTARTVQVDFFSMKLRQITR